MKEPIVLGHLLSNQRRLTLRLPREGRADDFHSRLDGDTAFHPALQFTITGPESHSAMITTPMQAPERAETVTKDKEAEVEVEGADQGEVTGGASLTYTESDIVDSLYQRLYRSEIQE